ncbi:hypothetical protein [Maribacter flavus]|uniref:Uncharacterized protein n=1 Tax=Maribacter flavus TaxID=1658664 RepID=A0A5B2TUS2_9FLAO|nr:hypothetical protein [Maribacter flavus]KAA2218261.1 hypothetical protein F0361_01175 [Maribacter flavus]
MKWKLAAQLATVVMTILGIDKIPIDGEGKKVAFSDDQKNELKDFLKDEKQMDEMMEMFNKDLSNMETENQREERLKNELRTALRQTNLTEEEVETKIEEGDVEAQLKLINKNQKEQKALIEKLLKSPEDDSPIATGPKIGPKAMHSATHLFGDNKAWNAFEDRPWNQRAAGIVTTATDWVEESVNVDKLNGDLKLYYRENPDEIKSLHRDNFGLPSFWPKRMNVVDTIASGTIVTAEISQARKLPWLPKNNNLIQPEEGKIYPIQIDMEFVGYYLQQLEASWIAKLTNREGSQPYKMTFVQFLVSEFDKKARVEDRIATVKGVHVDTPKDATQAGKFINRQDGLLYQFYKARHITKKYKPFAVGTPTVSNIVDYVDKIIERLPLEVRVNPNLVFYISPYWMKAYKRRYEQLHGTQNDYVGYPTNPKDYSNVKFEVMPDLEGLDFMFITFDDNIEILENIPKEKSLYRFEYLLRKIYVWADYKLGVRLIHIGTTVKDGDPLEFKVQTVWSNDVSIFPADFSIPVFDTKTGRISAKYGYMKVEDGWNTTVTHIDDAKPGQIIKIEGNPNIVESKNVNSTGNLSLASTFDLKQAKILTLFVKADGSIVELKREDVVSAAAPADVNFDAGIIDASEGVNFYSTAAANEVLDEITNGVEGNEITIYGPPGAPTLTINDVAGNIEVASQAVLATASDKITLVKTGGVWYESERTIA